MTAAGPRIATERNEYALGTQESPVNGVEAADDAVKPIEAQLWRIRLPRTFSSFRHRNYRLFFIGQTISLIGTWMHIAAQGWVVYDLARSPFVLGLVMAISAVTGEGLDGLLRAIVGALDRRADAT